MPKSDTVVCNNFIIPRSTIWILIINVLLLIDLIFSLLAVTDIVDAPSWRWVVCGMAFAFVLIYLVLFIFNARQIQRAIWKRKNSRNNTTNNQGTYSSKKDEMNYIKHSTYSFVNSLELQNAVFGFLAFLFMSVFWAIFMGVNTDDMFLITTNISNYIILKIFYLYNILSTYMMFVIYFNYPFDVLDQRLSLYFNANKGQNTNNRSLDQE